MEKVDQEIAARVDERLAARWPRTRPVEPGNRRALLKGFAIGVAASVTTVVLIAGAAPGHHALLWLLVLAMVGGAGSFWASRHRASRRTALRQGARAAGGDYRRLT